MTVYVFGNPDLPQDALPLRLLPDLRRVFPAIDFQMKDPNEDWELPSELFIIDTVQGLTDVKVFTSLDQFTSSPHVTMHDFDLGLYLQWLKKLGRLPKLTIFGLPPTLAVPEALAQLTPLLRQYGA